MRLTVNGEAREIELGDTPTVKMLLHALGIDRAPCAVEVNRRIVSSPDHGTLRLAEGDTVEVVTLVGGG